MNNLQEACRELVDRGLAERVSGGAIHFTGKVDAVRLYELERHYAQALNKRRFARRVKEREAARKLRDFVLDY